MPFSLDDGMQGNKKKSFSSIELVHRLLITEQIYLDHKDTNHTNIIISYEVPYIRKSVKKTVKKTINF